MTRAILLAGLLAAACGPRATAVDGYLTIALTNSPTNLDPAIGADEASQKLHQVLYSSLLRIDDALRVVPDLATRFETTDSQTWVAEIPDGVRFHDGRPLTSDDVAFTFRRFLDPAFVSVRKGAYRDLASVETSTGRAWSRSTSRRRPRRFRSTWSWASSRRARAPRRRGSRSAAVPIGFRSSSPTTT